MMQTTVLTFMKQTTIGVTFHKLSNKFQALCCDVIQNKQIYLGLFDNPEDAHKAWLNFKLKQAYILAEKQTDPRVVKALIKRYTEYTTNFYSEA